MTARSALHDRAWPADHNRGESGRTPCPRAHFKPGFSAPACAGVPTLNGTNHPGSGFVAGVTIKLLVPLLNALDCLQFRLISLPKGQVDRTASRLGVDGRHPTYWRGSGRDCATPSQCWPAGLPRYLGLHRLARLRLIQLAGFYRGGNGPLSDLFVSFRASGLFRGPMGLRLATGWTPPPYTFPSLIGRTW